MVLFVALCSARRGCPLVSKVFFFNCAFYSQRRDTREQWWRFPHSIVCRFRAQFILAPSRPRLRRAPGVELSSNEGGHPALNYLEWEWKYNFLILQVERATRELKDRNIRRAIRDVVHKRTAQRALTKVVAAPRWKEQASRSRSCSIFDQKILEELGRRMTRWLNRHNGSSHTPATGHHFKRLAAIMRLEHELCGEEDW